MALNLTVVYPAQVLSGVPGYPYGKPRNVTVSGDGTGTPWEAQLVSDWSGFFQSLLATAGFVPSGSPDRVGASQYTDAIKFMIANVNSDTHVNGTEFAFKFQSFAGDAIGGGHNFLGLTDFTGTTEFHNGWVSDQQAQVQLGGIVVAPGAVVLGNGIDGILVLAGGITVLVGASSFTPPTTFHDEIILADAGRIRKRHVFGANANTTYAITAADVLVLQSGVVTATRVYKVDDVGASEGSEFEIWNFTGFTQTIQNIAGGAIGTCPAISGGIPGRMRLSWVDNGTGARWTQVA